MPGSTTRLLIWLTLFGSAFGVIEGCVVVYLRELYYPQGFVIGPRIMDQHIMVTEIFRELATLLLLLSVAMLAVKGGLRRLAVFAFCFGVWDIVYYIVLKVVLDWPDSLLTWDILFLLPVIWSSPILAPMLVSAALIGASVVMLSIENDLPQLTWLDWLIETGTGILILTCFMWNAPLIMRGGMPTHFSWWLFGIGLFGGLGWFAWRFIPQRILVFRPRGAP